MKPILKANGQLRGYISENSDKRFIHAPGGRLLGWYVKNQDKTYTHSGQYVGTGDQTASLLED